VPVASDGRLPSARVTTVPYETDDGVADALSEDAALVTEKLVVSDDPAWLASPA
jgi:hypothetical protein